MNSTSIWFTAISLLALGASSGCSPAEQQQDTDSRTTIVGTLENNDVDEASGMARSQRSPDTLWVVNDDGPSVLHAIDTTGGMLGRVKIADASNRDWEDMASFTLDGIPYLLLADIGDNDGDRKDVRFYVVEEPNPEEKKVDYAWRVDFSYPGGPRDAEAIAVDVENNRVLVLSKRDIPARLYSVPLRPDSDKRQEASSLTAVGGLPRPSRRDVSFAPKTDDYYWSSTDLRWRIPVRPGTGHGLGRCIPGRANRRQPYPQSPGGSDCVQRYRQRHLHHDRAAQRTAVPPAARGPSEGGIRDGIQCAEPFR
jgi:hypothetical protein